MHHSHSNTLKPPRQGRPPPLPSFPSVTLVAPGTSPAPSPGGTAIPRTSTPAGLRAQLHHLLPRHARFRVRLAIHALASVPLVSGQFAVRWKFAGVQSAPFRALRRHDDNDDASSIAPSTSSTDTSLASTPPANGSPTESSLRSSLSSTTSSSLPSIPSVIINGSTAPPPSPSASQIPPPLPPPPSDTGPARGMTPWAPLHEHIASFEHALDIVVRMDVERDTGALLPLALKLVVMQRVIPGDPGAPRNPRFGALHIDLAQYAGPDTGPVTRRYLLAESKTNATLKITLHVAHVSGATDYIAPPLPAGEILGGISGLLASDVYRTRPRLALAGPAPPALPQLGPRTTEALIEALFNPVPSAEARPSPFTYYAPAAAAAREKEELEREPEEGAGGEAASVYSSSTGTSDRASASTSTSVSVHSYDAGEQERRGPWWRRRRPGTPVVG